MGRITGATIETAAGQRKIGLESATRSSVTYRGGPPGNPVDQVGP